MVTGLCFDRCEANDKVNSHHSSHLFLEQLSSALVLTDLTWVKLQFVAYSVHEKQSCT